MKDFDRDVLVRAINKIKENPELREGRESQVYDLVYEGEHFPPILVLSVANELMGGGSLTLSDFGNNTDKAFKTLEGHDFTIQRKSFIDQLEKFLEQAETGNLRTKHYISKYRGLNVKVSFGQGNQAKIPWISFLKEGHKTSEGIYPVYLLYKNHNLLILAYGISETHDTNVNWDLEDKQTINEYFAENNLGKPFRYGESYVFRAYDLNSVEINSELDKDLEKIIGEYKGQDSFKASGKVDYWLFAPGENGKYWDEFYEEGIMAIGWDHLGNLKEYKTQDEITEKLSKEGDKRRTNDSKACFQFVNEVKEGDIIIAKAGTSKLLGYGKVSSDKYLYDRDRDYYKNVRFVDWKKRGSWEVNFQFALKALTRITDYETDHPDYDKYYNRLLSIMGAYDSPPSDEEENSLTQSTGVLNRILYGPPGTGKTYHTIDIAVDIITGENNGHKENKKTFDRLKNEGLIEFVTFHQNYSYEDFVVGLRPDVNDQKLRFEEQKGIFYQICNRARENYENYISGIERRSFEQAFQDVIKPLNNSEDSEVPIEMKSGINFYITNVTDTSIEFRKHSGGTAHTLNINTLKDVVQGNKEMPMGLSSYYEPLVNLIKQKRKISDATPDLNRYVLIIDEINRANISRVFGELITLLEEDKRLGAPNELRTSLPNGESDFAVPPNLYLLGTMNTADKSIALVDVALRRRFKFISYYPDYTLIDNSEARELLKHINDEIFKRKKTADYLIGHSYFMQDRPIRDILNNSIIPLLMEYFSGKRGIVEDVLSGSGWDVKFNEETYTWDFQ